MSVCLWNAFWGVTNTLSVVLRVSNWQYWRLAHQQHPILDRYWIVGVYPSTVDDQYVLVSWRTMKNAISMQTFGLNLLHSMASEYPAYSYQDADFEIQGSSCRSSASRWRILELPLHQCCARLVSWYSDRANSNIQWTPVSNSPLFGLEMCSNSTLMTKQHINHIRRSLLTWV